MAIIASTARARVPAGTFAGVVGSGRVAHGGGGSSPFDQGKKDCIRKIGKIKGLERPSPQGGQHQARRKSAGPEPRSIDTGRIV